MAIVKGAVAGAIAGLAGALAMEQFQAWWSATEKRLAPAQRAGAAKDEPVMASGSVLCRRLRARACERRITCPIPSSRSAAAIPSSIPVAPAAQDTISAASPTSDTGNGLAFGAALWWIADNTAVPDLGLGTPPDKTPPSTHAYALASHLVYGAVTETVRRLVRIAL